VSYLIDPPLLVAAGAAIERTTDDEAAAKLLGAATVATFVGVSLALYANAPGLERIWKPFGARSGREFMLTSGLARVDEKRIGPSRHAVALALFALYPAWLRLGTLAARRAAR